MASLLDSLPPAIRDNLGLITLVIGTGVVVALAESTSRHRSSIDERKLSSERKSRTLNELPHYKSEASNSARMNNRRVSVAGESVNADTFKKADKVVYPKTGEQRERIAKAAEKLLLLRNLDHMQLGDIVDAMFERKVAAGNDIIKQGEEGDNFYLVDSGAFEIFVDGRKVADAKVGNGFGELALLYDMPRAATVRATVDSVLWAVDRTSFRRIVMGSNMRKRQTHEAFLKSVTLLSSLSPAEIVKVVDALQPVHFSAGEVILNEGEVGETFYIIEEGEAVVHKLGDDGKNQELGRKKTGDYFGEIALLNDGYRVASVTAVTDVSCLALDKPAFTRLLGPCVDILKRNMSNYQQYSKLIE